MHWLVDGLSQLCQVQGLPLPPRPVFPTSTTTAATEELPDVDDSLDDTGAELDDSAPLDD